MNIASMLAPVVSATLGSAAQQVSQAVQSGVSFASALRDAAMETDSSQTGDPDQTASGQGPAQTELSQQVQWDAIRQNLESLRQSVQAKLHARFAQHEIDLSEPAILVADQHGRVLEAGRHWDRAKIEELLATDSELRQQVSLLLQHAASLYQDSGSQAAGMDAQGPADSQLRLVVAANDVFFQVV